MAPVSASVLMCTGMASLQSRPDELPCSLASSRVAACHAPEKARRPGVEPTLALALGLGVLPSRVETLSDHFVQQLGDTSIRIARRLLEAGLHRGRNAPRVDFALAGHALQCNATLGVNQSM